VGDLETSRMRRQWPALGRRATEKKLHLVGCFRNYIMMHGFRNVKMRNSSTRNPFVKSFLQFRKEILNVARHRNSINQWRIRHELSGPKRNVRVKGSKFRTNILLCWQAHYYCTPRKTNSYFDCSHPPSSLLVFTCILPWLFNRDMPFLTDAGAVFRHGFITWKLQLHERLPGETGWSIKSPSLGLLTNNASVYK